MLVRKEYQFWLCTGSQDLYGDECLAHVAEHAKIIVQKLNESGKLPFTIVWKPTLITNELIRKTFNEANTDECCAGVITWIDVYKRQVCYMRKSFCNGSKMRNQKSFVPAKLCHCIYLFIFIKHLGMVLLLDLDICK